MKKGKSLKKLQKIEKLESEEELFEELIGKTDTLLEEENEEAILPVKKLTQDPWQNVHRKALSDRKAITGRKIFAEKMLPFPQQKQITVKTGARRAFEFPKISSKRTPLKKRRAQQINTLDTGINQVLKDVLTDYNSIEFFSKVS